MTGRFECYVCSKSKPHLSLRNFGVLYYWMQELICRDCWEMETGEPKEGEWNDPGCTTNLKEAMFADENSVQG